MTDRPILFSGPMVRAILDGRKTMTRRLVRGATGAFWDHGAWTPTVTGNDIRWDCAPHGPHSMLLRCPYGVPGDRLWVRETWALGYHWDRYNPSSSRTGEVWYRADTDEESVNRGRWRPSIHMPRWASRITLDVVRVRVERLQAITAKDVQAEGVQLPVSSAGAPKGKVWPLIRIPNPYEKPPKDWTEADFWRCEFACLWNEINGKAAPAASDPATGEVPEPGSDG